MFFTSRVAGSRRASGRLRSVTSGTLIAALLGSILAAAPVSPLAVGAADHYITNEVEFLGLIGDHTVENFDSFAEGTEITQQVPGVTFRTAGEPLYAFSTSAAVSEPRVLFGGFQDGGPQEFHAAFEPKARAVGFYIAGQHPASSPATVEVFTTTGTESFEISDGDENEDTPTYFGFVSSGGLIQRVTVTSGFETDTELAEEIGLDNFAFAIPEPTPGESIVFSRKDAGGSFDLWRISSNGTGLRRLTDHPGGEHDPDLSPDGSKVVFTGVRNGNVDLYLLDVATGLELRLTTDPAHDADPT
jgi:WD40 repeat protein